MKKTLLIILVIVISASISVFSFSCKATPAKEAASSSEETKEVETTASEATSAVTTSSDTSSTETAISEDTSETSSSETTSTSGQNTNLTQQEAIDIAKTVAEGSVDRVETEIEDGRLVWKVRIVSDGTRTDIRIDDLTGEVVRVETKDD